MRVLLTGGAGYIGSHVAELLRQKGYEPVIYDDLSTGHEWALRGEFYRGDILNLALFGEVLDRVRPAALMHFASKTAVGESMERPGLYFRVNVSGGINVFTAAAERGIPVIFSSSAAVYGAPERVPIPEDAPLRPTSVYGETKLMLERVLEWLARTRGLRYVSLRYFNAAGAAWGLGEVHEPETHLIPNIIRVKLGLRDKLVVFGNDYPTPDGTAIRDYIHVIDLAEAHLAALEHLLGGGEPQVLNLGTGTGYSVFQVVKEAEKVIGPFEWEFGPRRPGDPPVLVASYEKAEKVLGWKPKRRLGEMIRDAWEFLRGYFRGSEP